MDRFQAMQIFVRVVDANSFTRAAEHLGVPRSTITTTIQKLERLLQVRLLNRTTRRISLTPDGAAYYSRCLQILADIEEAEASFRDVTRGPKGRLRVDVPPSIGRLILLPALCDFHTRYPDIELAIGMSDRPVDMVQEAVDCVVRVGALQDSSLVAKRIGTFESVTCAAPEYLERYGVPKTIDDVRKHRVVHYFSSRTGRNIDWSFMVDGQTSEIAMKGPVAVNDAEAYVTCGLKGFGLIQPAYYMVQPHLESGDLIEILSEYTPASMPISLVYLHRRHLAPQVRVFVDWISELFESCPLMSGRNMPAVMDTECNFSGNHEATMGLRRILEERNRAESMA